MIDRIEGNQELARKISPTVHLHKDFPPALIMFGAEDRLKPHGDEYREKAGSLGVRAEEYTQKGLGHGFFNASPWMEHTLIAADRFLASLGFIEGEPTIREPSEEELDQSRKLDRKRAERQKRRKRERSEHREANK
jgi:acetyl esterase/lipase